MIVVVVVVVVFFQALILKCPFKKEKENNSLSLGWTIFTNHDGVREGGGGGVKKQKGIDKMQNLTEGKRVVRSRD